MTACNCKERQKPIKDRNWRIKDYRCNYSAFNGYRMTISDYSQIECSSCGKIWRTKAKYVDELLFRVGDPKTEPRDEEEILSTGSLTEDL